MMNSSEEIPALFAPPCGHTIKLIYDSTGETMYCDRPVVLHVCRGRNKDPVKAARNKGYLYEACTQPQPEGPHFHRWRYDLPRDKLPDNSGGSDFIFSEMSPSQFSLQDLFNIPITPETSPISSTFNPSTIMTPTRRPIATTIPNNSPLPSDPASNFPGTSSSLISSGSGSAIGTSTPNDNHPHTRNAINLYTGKPMVACNGPVCRLNRANSPTRYSLKCTHQFCKKCCIYLQEAGHVRKCSARTHSVPRQDVFLDLRSEGPSNEVIPSTPNELSGFSLESAASSSTLHMTDSERERIVKRLLDLRSLEYL